MKKGFKKAMSIVLSAAMLVSLDSGMILSIANAVSSNARENKMVASADDVKNGYRAWIAYQTSKYDCRSGYGGTIYEAEADAAYNAWARENGKEVTDDYNGCNLYLNGNVPNLNKRTKKLRHPENVEVCTGASVVDAVMGQDGEYTVSISNLDLRKSVEVKNYFNELFVSTDIPIKKTDDPNQNVSVKATSVKIDGKEYADGNTILPVKGDVSSSMDNTYVFMFANGYAPDDGTAGCKYQKADPVKLGEDGSECMAATDLEVPNTAFSIEITFSITGVDWEKPLETAEPTKTPVNRDTDEPKVTLPPVKDLKKPFDVYLNANVNEALTPSEGEGTRQNVYGSTIMAACFGSEEMKEKVLSAKDEKGRFVFDGSKDYIIEDSASATITKTGTYTLSVTARGSIDNLVDQGAIWFSVLMDGSVSSTITDFTLIGKSITVEAGKYSETFPWSAQLIKDSAGVNRLTVCNKWESEDVKDKTNTVTDTIEIIKGDKISFTFYVIGTGDVESSGSPEVTESAKPSESPEVTESTKPSESPQVTESTKPSESPEVTESAKPSESPQVTESAKPNDSPEVTESAKPSDNPEVTESTKPSESPEVTESTKPSASPQVTESAKPGNLPTAVPSGNGKQQSNTGNNGEWDGGQDDETSVMYVTQKRDMSEEIGEKEQAEFYRSSNKKVATINANGILVAKAAGKTTITIGLDDGTVLTYPIVVKIPKIVLSKTKIKLPKNSVSRALRVKKKLSTDKIKSYVVSKKKIVKISKRGAIKGLKRGNTTVTVVMKSGAKASCRVTVR